MLSRHIELAIDHTIANALRTLRSLAESSAFWQQHLSCFGVLLYVLGSKLLCSRWAWRILRGVYCAESNDVDARIGSQLYIETSLDRTSQYVQGCGLHCVTAWDGKLSGGEGLKPKYAPNAPGAVVIALRQRLIFITLRKRLCTKGNTRAPYSRRRSR